MTLVIYDVYGGRLKIFSKLYFDSKHDLIKKVGRTYSQGFNFEPRAGGEVRIFGFYNNEKKRKKKEENETEREICNAGWHMDCLLPPLTTMLPGIWKCPLCTPPAPLSRGALRNLRFPSPILDPDSD